MQENLSDDSFSTNILQNNKEFKEKKCMMPFICWIFTFLIWGLLGMVIYIFIPVRMDSENFYKQYQLYSIKQKLKGIVITAIIILYIVYIFLEFFSPIVIYLKQDEQKDLKNLMEKLFGARPSFIFKYNLNNSMNEKFEYNYYRDISGLFELNITNEELKNKKLYIMLKINYEIKFADNDTEKAYNSKKKEFKEKIIRERGNIKSIEVVKELKKVKKYYKVKTNEEDCCFIDFCLYIIFTILTFAELYKLYINSKIIYAKFFIIKAVSVNQNFENLDLYNSLNPRLKFEDKVYSYEQITKKLNHNKQNWNKNEVKISEKTDKQDTEETSEQRSSDTKLQNI
jgi:hypothetical protein